MRVNIFFKFIFLTALALTINAKELKIVGAWKITGMEPAQSGYIFSRTQVAETLMTVDKTGKVIPSLAKKIEVSKDGLTWDITLREKVKFHDGSSLNANIVVSNLNREVVLTKSVLRKVPLKSIEAIDNKVQIKLNSQFSPLPAYLAHYSTIILSKNSFDTNGKTTKIIGTGAYKIKSISVPSSVKLTKNENWWNGEANIKDISYLAVPKGESRTLMVKSGEANIAYNIMPISAKTLKRNPNLNTTVVAIPRTSMLKVNAASPYLNNKNLREAISLSINRKGIAKALLHNETLAATQMFPSGVNGWHNTSIKQLTYDIEKAKALLEKEGWKVGKDGYRYKNGKKLEITLDTYASRSLNHIATAIKAQLKKSGIYLKVIIGDYTEIVNKHKDNTLELGLISRNFSLVPNPLGTLLSDYSKGGATWGAMNWDNPSMFKYLDELKKGGQLDIRDKITELLQNELPTIPVVYSELIVVSNKKLKNFYVDPYELNYFLSEIKW
ncbi:ABC transporter substrate-binding protein [Poseidonibacter lekithochrous]|uniref:ABC transporter substrate-binding protein n=1 Tax=Poseidonibacter lekithochrous TaxID=1904463 RepID=UPI0008FCB180|nr:ABC transporter substrate-binding protein [Poseidonibacter lekithochrous]QKJ23164.1 ABC transporter, periplasmic substrate-binding protein [Poseidonibacter lekithochrous]